MAFQVFFYLVITCVMAILVETLWDSIKIRKATTFPSLQVV